MRPATIRLAAGVVTPTATAETSLEAYPPGYAPDGTRRAVIYCHGSQGRSWEASHPSASGLPSLTAQLRSLVDAGFPLLSCDNGLVGAGAVPSSSESWANNNAISRVADAVAYAQSPSGMGAKTDKVLLIGASMGGAVAMAYARANPSKVAGLILLRPVASLQDFGTVNGFTGINGAYGGTYSDTTDGPTHSPIQFASQLTGIPTVIYAASDDAVCTYSVTQNLATASGATLTNIGPGGHTDVADQHIAAGEWLVFARTVA